MPLRSLQCNSLLVYISNSSWAWSQATKFDSKWWFILDVEYTENYIKKGSWDKPYAYNMEIMEMWNDKNKIKDQIWNDW